MSERASYSRVYWSIVDDPKFEAIYDSDSHLAAWLRLLLIADQAHPASAHLPANVRKASVAALADVGLIDLTGQRYRIHGLDAERTRRANAATRDRTGRDPSGTQTVPNRDPNGTQSIRTHRAVGRGLDETRLDEGTRENDPYDDAEGDALAWLSRHGCDVRPGNGYHQKLVVAVEQHGSNAVIGMFDRLARAGTHPGDVKGFLFGAIDALNAQSRPKLAEVEAEDREEERRTSFAIRAARTREQTAELRAAIEEKA